LQADTVFKAIAHRLTELTLTRPLLVTMATADRKSTSTRTGTRSVVSPRGKRIKREPVIKTETASSAPAPTNMSTDQVEASVPTENVREGPNLNLPVTVRRKVAKRSDPLFIAPSPQAIGYAQDNQQQQQEFDLELELKRLAHELEMKRLAHEERKEIRAYEDRKEVRTHELEMARLLHRATPRQDSTRQDLLRHDIPADDNVGEDGTPEPSTPRQDEVPSVPANANPPLDNNSTDNSTKKRGDGGYEIVGRLDVSKLNSLEEKVEKLKQLEAAVKADDVKPKDMTEGARMFSGKTLVPVMGCLGNHFAGNVPEFCGYWGEGNRYKAQFRDFCCNGKGTLCGKKNTATAAM
jgi:hypothetical protein